MRQDKAFEPGEIVSQRLAGKFIGSLVDEVITVDPHLHRIDSLDQVIKANKTLTLTAAPLISNHISLQVSDPVIVGPDEESIQWVKNVAELQGYEYMVAEKTRHSDREVDIVLPHSDFEGRNVVLIDDVASTGKTLMNAAQQLQEHGVKNIYCAITHALFVENSYENLLSMGVKEVWSTDSVAHPSNCISLASMIAESMTVNKP